MLELLPICRQAGPLLSQIDHFVEGEGSGGEVRHGGTTTQRPCNAQTRPSGDTAITTHYAPLHVKRGWVKAKGNKAIINNHEINRSITSLQGNHQ